MQHLDSEILRLARTRRGPYLAALSAPSERHGASLALLAFDAELARIPEVVSEPMLGRVRLQWWLDALPDIVGGHAPSQHPVAQALAALCPKLEPLRTLAEAYNFALEEDTATVQEHCQFADASGGALATLMLDAADIDDRHVHSAACAIYAAWRLVETLRDGRRVASDADGEALRAHAWSRIEQARAQVLPKNQRRAAYAVLGLARLVARGLKNPQAPLGAGAVLSIWWGSVLGSY